MILLVDGCNMAFRCYAAHTDLRASTGEGTGAIYGMLKALHALKKDFSPQRMVVVWDYGASTWRKKIYPEYKAHRRRDADKTQQDYYAEYLRQLGRIRSAVDMLGIPQIQVPGVEADDLIGIAVGYIGRRGDVGIVSSDKDFYQLLRQGVRIWQPQGGGTYKKLTVSKFASEYQFDPMYWPDVRALMGDKSDNIPGVRGVGEVRATDLVRRYGGIKEILEASDADDSVLKQVQAHAVVVCLYRILCVIPWAVSLVHYDNDTAMSIRWEMRKLADRTPKINKDAFRDFCFDTEMMSIHRAREGWFQLFGGQNGRD